MAFVVKSKEAVNLNLPGRISKELISKKNGSKNISLRLVTIKVDENGEKRSPHYHPNSEECIYVLNGYGMTVTDKEKHFLNKGDAIFIPKGEKHYTLNVGKENLSLICFFPTEQVEIIT
tara:strand:+ start:656 stop:1012 length:357 start_codon:yes stop_codon:yes gene_type:complete